MELALIIQMLYKFKSTSRKSLWGQAADRQIHMQLDMSEFFTTREISEKIYKYTLPADGTFVVRRAEGRSRNESCKETAQYIGSAPPR